MDPRQQRLIEDLADTFGGELFVDPLHRSLYATDAGTGRIVPAAVACPRETDDVVALVKYAIAHHLPLTPRGAGTTTFGAAIGEGLVVDFARHMRAIGEIGTQTVRVEPGVTLEQLQSALAAEERTFAPDPLLGDCSTLGGLAARDAFGPHVSVTGSVRDHMDSLETVLGDGRCLELARQEVGRRDQPAGVLANQLAALMVDQPAEASRDAVDIAEAITSTAVDFPQLLAGSYGTRGLFTALTLRTMPLPAARAVCLLTFASLDGAVRAVPRLSTEAPAACELLDRRLLSLGRELSPWYADAVPVQAEAALILDFTAASRLELDGLLHRLASLVHVERWECSLRHVATEPADAARLWRLPSQAVAQLHRLSVPNQPVPSVGALSVPPLALDRFLERARHILQQHRLTAALQAHAVAGIVHLRPIVSQPTNDLRNGELAEELGQAAIELGGGAPRASGPLAWRQRFDRAPQLFEAVQRVFDPHQLLNPFHTSTPQTESVLRPRPVPHEQVLDLQLRWSPAEAMQEAAGCHGCGACRSQSPGLRMCPFFRTNPAEAASPRAKANLVREHLGGALTSFDLGSDAVKPLMDECFNCKQCVRECPSHIDIPHLVLEARAQYVAAHGLSRADWFVSRTPDWAPWLSRWSSLLNVGLSRRGLRWLLEQSWGVARQRKLPTWARRSFWRQAAKSWLEPPSSTADRPVIGFLDHHPTWHDPSAAVLLFRLLEQQGLTIHVPPTQLHAGMAAISLGDFETARGVAEHNVRILAEFARAGCPIVCLEPSSVVALRNEYPRLLDGPEVRLVADAAVEAGAFLVRLKQEGRWRTELSPQPSRVAYHAPCHTRFLSESPPWWQVLSWIPGFQGSKIEAGCSGMAGAFGLTSANFPRSLEMGCSLAEALQASPPQWSLAECSSCRLQMEQFGPAPAIHPVKLLAWASGLQSPPTRPPRLRSRLSTD